MPRYFFHTTNGERFTRDVEGVELPDIPAVELEAREMAHGLLTASLVARPEWTGWWIEVRDENGQQVLTLPML
jgi:uncharacterized protein DUF6894